MEESYYAKLSKQFSESLASYVREIIGTPSEISSMISSLQDSLLLLSETLIECMPTEQMIAESLKSLTNQLMGLYSISAVGVSEISVSEETIAPIREMAPFVPEEKREEFQKIVAPDVEGKNKIISTENIKWLIATVISVIAIIVSLKTQAIDDETKQILRDGNEIEARKLEVMESGLAAVNDLLNYLQESGVDFSEDCSPIAEQTDSLSQDQDGVAEIPDSEKQNNKTDSQSQSNEIQE